MKLNLKGLNPEQKARAKAAAGQILVEETNAHLDRSESPVKNGKFKEEKADGEKSTLFEFGFMRENIIHRPDPDDAVLVGVFEDAPEVERLKIFNHNTGDTVPQRRAVPSPNQKYRPEVMEKVNASIEAIRRGRARPLSERLGVGSVISDEDLARTVLENAEIDLEIL